MKIWTQVYSDALVMDFVSVNNFSNVVVAEFIIGDINQIGQMTLQIKYPERQMHQNVISR